MVVCRNGGSNLGYLERWLDEVVAFRLMMVVVVAGQVAAVALQ